MNTNPIYDLLCIGNYTKDTIISPSGTKYVDGGAVNYAAHAANRLGNRVAVLTHLARDDQRVVEKFQESGIDCFFSYTSSSTLMKLEYPNLDPDTRTLSVTGTADPILAIEMEAIQARSAVIGTSFRGEVSTDAIHALKRRNIFLGADMQGFVRVLKGVSLVYEPWDEMDQILPHLDVLKSDAVEAQYLTGEADLFKAAAEFSRLGAKEVLLTHRDGVLVYAGGEFHQAAFHSRALDGRSGRGDTCLGAYMAMRKYHPPFQAAIWATAVTSLKMENLGPFDKTLDDVSSLVRDKYSAQLSHFAILGDN
jgi:sugar/nucleoside kinase (ribokinase family)